MPPTVYFVYYHRGPDIGWEIWRNKHYFDVYSAKGVRDRLQDQGFVAEVRQYDLNKNYVYGLP